MNFRIFGALGAVLLLSACGTIYPSAPNVCQASVAAWGGCSNQDEHAAKSAPGGNPAPAAPAKPADPPKVDKPEPPKPDPKPPGDKPDRPGKPGHGHGDKNHDHEHEGRGSGTPDGRNTPGDK